MGRKNRRPKAEIPPWERRRGRSLRDGSVRSVCVACATEEHCDEHQGWRIDGD